MTSTIKCNCGEQAKLSHIVAYWWEVFCDNCTRFRWGYGTEMEARTEWLRSSHEERETGWWINYYIPGWSSDGKVVIASPEKRVSKDGTS